MPKKINCDTCEKEVKLKHINKVRGRRLCSSCYKENRLNHRRETINGAGIEKELEDLRKKSKREINKRHYKKKNTFKKPKTTIEDLPKIKGSKKKERNSCYIPFKDRQILFKMLIKRGLDGEEAKERIQMLIDEQKRISESMKEKGKSNFDIKVKQNKMLQELWNI